MDVTLREVKYVGDFYFDARYPGENFTTVDEEAINDCIEITENVRKASLKVLNETQTRTLDLPPASDIQ